MTISKKREVAVHGRFDAAVTGNPLLVRRTMHSL